MSRTENILHRNFFFFNDTATTEIYTLSLLDALPISRGWLFIVAANMARDDARRAARERRHLTLLKAEPQASEAAAADDALHAESERTHVRAALERSEEHTSELQSNLVCRLLLEKKTAHLEHVLRQLGGVAPRCVRPSFYSSHVTTFNPFSSCTIEIDVVSLSACQTSLIQSVSNHLS